MIIKTSQQRWQTLICHLPSFLLSFKKYTTFAALNFFFKLEFIQRIVTVQNVFPGLFSVLPMILYVAMSQTTSWSKRSVVSAPVQSRYFFAQF